MCKIGLFKQFLKINFAGEKSFFKVPNEAPLQAEAPGGRRVRR